MIANLNTDTSLKLLFANTIVLNLSWVFLEASAYYVLYLRFKNGLKQPSKKDSTVQTKKNKKPAYPYENLADAEEQSKDKDLLDQLRPKKILYILGDREDCWVNDCTNSSKILNSESNEHQDDILKEIK